MGSPRGTVYLQALRWSWGWSRPIAIPMRDTRTVEGVRIVLEKEPDGLVSDGAGRIGVGLDFTPAGPVVNRVFEGSPAQRSGLQNLDLLAGVAGRPSRFMTPKEFIARCRGEVGTTVELEVVRPDGKRRTVSLVRSAGPWDEPR